MATKPVEPILIRVVVRQKWSPEKGGEEGACQDFCQDTNKQTCQDGNKQMQQNNKQTFLANTGTDGTNEGIIVIKLDEELGDKKEAKAVEGDDQSCLTCGQNKRKVFFYLGPIFFILAHFFIGPTRGKYPAGKYRY